MNCSCAIGLRRAFYSSRVLEEAKTRLEEVLASASWSQRAGLAGEYAVVELEGFKLYAKSYSSKLPLYVRRRYHVERLVPRLSQLVVRVLARLGSPLGYGHNVREALGAIVSATVGVLGVAAPFAYCMCFDGEERLVVVSPYVEGDRIDKLYSGVDSVRAGGCSIAKSLVELSDRELGRLVYCDIANSANILVSDTRPVIVDVDGAGFEEPGRIGLPCIDRTADEVFESMGWSPPRAHWTRLDGYGLAFLLTSMACEVHGGCIGSNPDETRQKILSASEEVWGSGFRSLLEQLNPNRGATVHDVWSALRRGGMCG